MMRFAPQKTPVSFKIRTSDARRMTRVAMGKCTALANHDPTRHEGNGRLSPASRVRISAKVERAGCYL